MMRTAALLVLAASGSDEFRPILPGGIVAWIVCNARKRNEFGGWLLYFYWQLYSGVIVTTIFFAINFQSYVPENFDDPARYYWFLASTVPVIAIFGLQAAVATMLISVRAWDLLRLLRGLIAAAVIAAIVSVAIDAKYFPDNIALGIVMTLIPECIWLAYFFVSKRVVHVFQTHNWDRAVEVIHPPTTKLVV